MSEAHGVLDMFDLAADLAANALTKGDSTGTALVALVQAAALVSAATLKDDIPSDKRPPKEITTDILRQAVDLTTGIVYSDPTALERVRSAPVFNPPQSVN